MSRAALATRNADAAASKEGCMSRNVPGLRIGEPNDSFEQEADRVAGEIATNGAKRDWSLSTMTVAAPLQRKCDCGSSGTCESCKEKEGSLQRKAAGPAASSLAPPIVHEVLSSPGEPLDKESREFFETRLGHDFSQVKLHTDQRAGESARSVNASAYTVGRDVVIGQGINNSTQSSRQLLAHELTHVVQQTAARPKETAVATKAASRIASGQRSAVKLAASPSLQRQPLTGNLPDIDLSQNASPLLASAIGSVTLDNFVTGKSDLSGDNQAKLGKTVETIWKLLKQYPASNIHVIGYTDAVGQESDNQALGQSRADTVQAALLALGLPQVSLRVESRGANDLLVKTKRAEGRNRRVDVRFETSTTFRGGLSGGLDMKPTETPIVDWRKEGKKVTADLCEQNPTLCLGKPGIPPTGGTPLDTKPIPSDIPFDLMDVPGLNDAYRSHGDNPSQGGDLTGTWAQMYLKYFRAGAPKKIAAKLANSELSGTAGQNESRDNPNSIDRSNTEMKHDFPDSKTIGPAFLPWKLEF